MAKRPTAIEGETAEVHAEPTPFDEFVEHERKAVQEFGKALAAVLPEGVREHGDAAVTEMIEGYRRLFNATLDDVAKLVERAKFDDKQADKKTKVSIE
jgi:hypothetical protein